MNEEIRKRLLDSHRSGSDKRSGSKLLNSFLGEELKELLPMGLKASIEIIEEKYDIKLNYYATYSWVQTHLKNKPSKATKSQEELLQKKADSVTKKNIPKTEKNETEKVDEKTDQPATPTKVKTETGKRRNVANVNKEDTFNDIDIDKELDIK